MFELTFIDSGKTVKWGLKKCEQFFGKAEFNEIRQGYAPHIVCIELE